MEPDGAVCGGDDAVVALEGDCHRCAAHDLEVHAAVVERAVRLDALAVAQAEGGELVVSDGGAGHAVPEVDEGVDDAEGPRGLRADLGEGAVEDGDVEGEEVVAGPDLAVEEGEDARGEVCEGGGVGDHGGGDVVAVDGALGDEGGAEEGGEGGELAQGQRVHEQRAELDDLLELPCGAGDGGLEVPEDDVRHGERGGGLPGGALARGGGEGGERGEEEEEREEEEEEREDLREEM